MWRVFGGKLFFFRFACKNFYPHFSGAVVPEAVDESIAEYDYENANDVDDFCPSLPDNQDAGNYDEGLEGEGGYFPSQSILPTQTQGKTFILYRVSHGE